MKIRDGRVLMAGSWLVAFAVSELILRDQRRMQRLLDEDWLKSEEYRRLQEAGTRT